jgi:hypothetical protein
MSSFFLLCSQFRSEKLVFLPSAQGLPSVSVLLCDLTAESPSSAWCASVSARSTLCRTHRPGALSAGFASVFVSATAEFGLSLPRVSVAPSSLLWLHFASVSARRAASGFFFCCCPCPQARVFLQAAGARLDSDRLTAPTGSVLPHSVLARCCSWSWQVSKRPAVRRKSNFSFVL